MTDEPIKYMDLDEFADGGWLQEANRLFFHPHGLALEISDKDQDGEYDTLSVWDYREDPEGMVFADDVLSIDKLEAVHNELIKHMNTRMRLIGSVVQYPGRKLKA